MIEAFKIAANLSITGTAMNQMTKFIQLVEKASLRVDQLQTLLKSSTRNMQTFNLSMGVSNKEFRMFNRSLYEAISKTAVLERNMRSLGRSMGGSGTAAGGSSIARTGMAAGISGYVGGLPMIAGAAALGVVHGSYKSNLSYNQQLMQLSGQNIAGLNAAQAQQYINTANRGPVSKMSLLEALVDAASVTKEAGSAKTLAPLLAQYKFNMNAMYPGHGFSPAQLQAAIKVAEITSGSKEASVIAPYIESMFKTSLSTGLRIQPSTYLAATKAMRGYGRGMDPNFFFYMLEPMFQEYGTRTGSMIAQFYQHMKVGRLTTQGAQLLGQMGLVNPKDVTLNKMGMIKGIKPGGILGQDLMGQNIFAWIDQFLIPAMTRMGLKTPTQQEGVLGKIFTNSDLTLVLTYLQQQAKFQQNYQANLHTRGMSEMTQQNLNNITGVNQSAAEAWQDFSLALSNLTSPIIIAGLKYFTWELKTISSFFDWLGNKYSAAKSGAISTFDSLRDKFSQHLAEQNKYFVLHNNVSIGGDKFASTTTKHIVNGMNQINEHGQSSFNGAYSPWSTSTPGGAGSSTGY